MRVSMLGLRAPGAEGGVEMAVAALGPRLVARGWQVRVICRRGWLPAGVDPRGMELVEVASPRGAGIEALVHTFLGLPSAVRGSDLVHLHAAGPAGLAPLARLAGRPVVVTLHGADWLRDRWGTGARLALRAAWAAAQVADGVVTVSSTLLAETQRIGATWIPNGVEAPVAPRRFDGLPQDFWLILGRVVPEKNLAIPIRAHARTPGAPPLVIAGSDQHDPKEYARLRALAGPAVHFVGARFGAEKAALLQGASLLICPSRLEGYPIVVLEGLAAGAPLLASDILAHREILGAAVGPRPDDEAGWIEAFAAFEPEVARRVARAGADAARLTWGWDAIADRTAALYEAILARSARQSPFFGPPRR